jgi:5-formaminoimidazole-4-carboxamide-1-(beta)-D-ribofuranosyl 5'-monophosphate synthetase
MGAVIILAHAGVLKGKKYTFPIDPTKFDPAKPSAVVQVADPNFNDAIYSGTGVIQDGVIITSGVCPTIEKFAKEQKNTVFERLLSGQSGREKTYTKYYKTRRDGRGCIDSTIVLDKFSDITQLEVQARLREENTIFIHNRYFWVYF